MSIIGHSASVCKPSGERVAVELQGHRFACRVQGGAQRGGGKRGRVRGFSRASRKRLLDRLASLDVQQAPGQRFVGQFLTLTYAGLECDLPVADALHRDVDVFLKAFLRLYPGASGAWRLEFDSKGSRTYNPHFHLIILGVPWVDRGRVRAIWNRVAGNPQGSPSTDVGGIRSWRGLLHYAAKYVSKVSGSGSLVYGSYLTGRIWGWFNDDALPLADLSIVEGLGGLEWFYDLRRLARRSWSGVPRGRGQGFTLYTGHLEQWRRALWWCLASA